MAKTVGGSSSAAVWDVSRSLPLQIMDGSVAYVYGPGGLPLEQVDGSTVLWYHHDQLGSTRVITDAGGNVRASYRYDPYGDLIASPTSVSNPFLYAGGYRDSESGLYYLRARYYEPGTGQFLTLDPLQAETRAPYRYAADTPVNATDPTGMWCFPPWSSSCEVDLPGGNCLANGAPGCSNGDTGIDNLTDNLTDPNPTAFIGFVRSVSPLVSLGSDIWRAHLGQCVSPVSFAFDLLGFTPVGVGHAFEGAARVVAAPGRYATAAQVHNVSLWLDDSKSGLFVESVVGTAATNLAQAGIDKATGQCQC
jgi:RHS repeat-associated protein